MNASVLLQLLRGSTAGNRARLALTVACIALGVALAGAVHTIHASALAEVDRAARTLAGRADLEVRGPRSGFDEAIYPAIAKRPEVLAASPVVEVEAPLATGKETLHVVGIDPFRAARLQPGFLAGTGDANIGWAVNGLDPSNAWLTPSALARLKARVGDSVVLRSGDQVVTLHIAGALPRLEAGGDVAVMDIAGAQERFSRLGLLSRIDVRLRPGADAKAFRASLAPVLPPGVVASEPASISGRAASLTRAYRVNLNALALMALLTGLFLVFSTLALQAARRREEYALLRALGVTGAGLGRLVLAEGAIVGVIGAAIGSVLGLVASRLILEWGSDLGAGYFRGLEATFDPDPLALAGIAFLGVATALAGAWLVARSAARIEIATALRDRAIDLPSGRRRAIPIALGLVVAAVPLLFTPPVAGLPLGGYTAIALWLAASVVLVAPVCRAFLARIAFVRDPIVQLAAAQFRHLPGHLAASVAGIVVGASLCAAMVVMVHSFRVSLDGWLTGVIGADLYARSTEGGDTVTFTPEQQRAVAALPAIERVDALRYDRLAISAEAMPVTLVARPVDERILRGFQAQPASRPRDAGSIAVWVSEAAVDLHGWHTGDRIVLPIAGKAVPVVVAGTFRDFARTWGAVLMDLGDYRRLTGDLAANDLAIYVRDRSKAAEAIAAIRASLASVEGLRIEDASWLHRRSLEVFDRTFAATYALEAVALVISLAGLTSSFAAIAWSRRREFGVLRHLGLTRREIARMLTVEGAVAGTLGAAIGLASGAAISLVLVQVVNRQSFHWGMEVHWPLPALAALAAILVFACAMGGRWSARAAVRDEAVRAVKDDA